MKRRELLGLGAAALVAPLAGMAACSAEIPDRRRQLLSSWGQGTLLSLYTDFELAVETLGVRVEELLAAPSPETLEAARSAWWSARAPFKQAELFAFGPYSDDPLRLGAKLDFWPVRPDTVHGVLSGTSSLDANQVELLGASAKGLPVVELLLYEPDVELVTEFAEVPRRGQYLQLLVQDLLGNIQALKNAWAPEDANYLRQFTEAGRGSTTFDSLSAALGYVVNQMGFLVERIRGDKVSRPLGGTELDSADPDKVESRYSGRSVQDILDNLSGLERSFFGDAERGELGLEGYLLWRGKDLGALLHARFDAARAALLDIPVALAEAVLTERASVSAALASLAELQRAFQIDVIQALSLSVSFGGNDGD